MNKWHDKISFQQAKNDYEYITNNYGNPCDFCGSLCNCDLLFDILNGIKSRKEAYIEMIDYIWDNGIEDNDSSCSSNIRPDESDLRIKQIKERYYID